MRKDVFRVNRRVAESELAVREIGQVVETSTLEHTVYNYKVVHIDDQDVLLERIRSEEWWKSKAG